MTMLSRTVVLLTVLVLVSAVAAFAPPPPSSSPTAPRCSALEMSSTQTYQGDLDTEALYATSTFPIKPDELITLAKDVIINKGIGLKDDGKCLTDDFIFRAAFVETPKDEFFSALKSFRLEDSFDLKQQYFGWIVDPLQPERVWFYNRQEARHVGDFMGAKPTPDSKMLVLPPQSLHLDFTPQGKVKEFGFYVVDRNQGNTGGLGGAFGFFYGVGRPLPFPEGKPYQMSFRRRLFTAVAGFLTKLSKKK
jgi:hypothetical protein